jgi:hypothetical protein
VSEDVAEFPAPQLLTTNIVDTAAEAVEAVHAADVLGLGVRLYNRLVPDIEDDSLVEEWVVEVFTSAPAVDPEGQTDDDGPRVGGPRFSGGPTTHSVRP